MMLGYRAATVSRCHRWKLKNAGALHIYRPARAISYGHMVVHEEVKEALTNRKPVVALESTILTHGMPFPDNLRMARSVESIIRRQGAIPATIALMGGKAYIGLTDKMLEQISDVGGNNAVKVSRRDLAFSLNQRLTGGTTISGTMLLAHEAGIRLFVSGGLGGVHRGGEVTMDVSADLTELSRTPVALVTSGVKSILDIGRTLEYLETQGVCVASYGSSSEFPAFFTANSGYQSCCNVTSVEEAARLINTTLSLRLNTGLLIANPIPSKYELQGQEIEKCIQQAVEESVESGIRGREITPYILKRVNELTQGKSLESNIALVENNALLGAKIAVKMSEIEVNEQNSTNYRTTVLIDMPDKGTRAHKVSNGRPTVIGACNLDTLLHIQEDNVKFSGSTNNAMSRLSCGGVGRNLSDGLSRLGANPRFLTALGDDLNGDKIVNWSSHMDWSQALRLKNMSTAHYTVVLNKQGDVVMGVGDMNIHDQITPDYIMEHEESVKDSSMIIMDGNLSIDAIRATGDLASRYNIPVFYEPTDTDKACRPFEAGIESSVTYIKPNLQELKEIYHCITGKRVDILDQSSGFISHLCDLCIEVSKFIPNILVTLGARGSMMYMRKNQINSSSAFHAWNNTECSTTVVKSSEEGVCLHACAQHVTDIKSVSGAGDCMAVGFIFGELCGLDINKSLELGVAGASLSLQSYDTVPSSIQQLAELENKVKVAN